MFQDGGKRTLATSLVLHDPAIRLCNNLNITSVSSSLTLLAMSLVAHAADVIKMTYSEVHAEVCRVANWLKSKGVCQGETVALYMPMILQLPIAMLACARIGAVHSVVFGGFSADALADRIINCGARVLVTANGVMRGTKVVQLKTIADQACGKSLQEGTQVPQPSRYLKCLPFSDLHCESSFGIIRGQTS
jgi:acyl-coenzyme A synthetase/AMP-(fatty) acid ligase